MGEENKPGFTDLSEFTLGGLAKTVVGAVCVAIVLGVGGLAWAELGLDGGVPDDSEDAVETTQPLPPTPSSDTTDSGTSTTIATNTTATTATSTNAAASC